MRSDSIFNSIKVEGMLTKNRVLIRSGDDIEPLGRGVQDEPAPAGTLDTEGSSVELLLEAVKGAKIAICVPIVSISDG